MITEKTIQKIKEIKDFAPKSKIIELFYPEIERGELKISLDIIKEETGLDIDYNYARVIIHKIEKKKEVGRER